MELDALRAKIDELDGDLLALFLRRMELAEGVAAYKREKNLPVLHPGREEEVLARAEKAAGEEMAPYARDFFESIMAISRRRQRALLEEGEEKPAAHS